VTKDETMHRSASTLRAAALTAMLALPAPAFAQQPSDAWSFGASIYGYFPTISGGSNFPASGNSPSVSVDVDRILDNLEFVFMGTLEARRGHWGAFTDVIYMDVGNARAGTRDLAIGGIGIPATASADVDYDLKALIWTLAGQYSVHATPEAHVDVFAGARLADLEQDVRWSVDGTIAGLPLPGRSGGSNVSRSNWDGIVGAKGRVRLGHEQRWFVPWYVDVGTGESDFTWQAMAGLGYAWRWGEATLGWRYLAYEFGSGKPFSDIDLSGPQLGIAFRW
jgi:hypothetical protein